MNASSQAGTSLLKNKVYMRVYSAYATATFGDWFDALAIQVLVGYRWHASPLMLALIPVSIALPGILLGSVAGVAADRVNKLKLMRMCDLLTALLTVLVLFAPNMVWLLPLLMLRAAISTLNVPAQQSMTRTMVREDQLLQATSLNGLVNQGSKIAGPLLGGFALSVLTPQWCILINACLRGCSYLLLLTVKKSEVEQVGTEGKGDQEEHVSLRTMWMEGWSFMLRSRLLLNTMLFGIVCSMAIQMIDFQFTSLFRVLAPSNESLLGWLVAASGGGAVFIIMVMNKMNRGTGYGWKLGTSYVLMGLSVGGLGLLQPGTSNISVLLLGFLLGIGNGIFIITFNYCLQKETPPHMTGRVFGIQSTILSGVMIGAPLLGGMLVQAAGPSRIFFNFGIVIALIGVLGILFGRVLWPVQKEKSDSSTEQPGKVKVMET
ncbi:DHA3 family macrolide efflux protein-like MFS transporter [Paenibacillus sp. PastF-3]|uniref:MFS transporter n=1 Tax=Paenibacillus sp. PastF-3 TaxID=2940626 RepID=UPI00247609D4|nr:MFS transporter [Paenibacillus sp. PastF-3]MDH6374435.1 DHA3 family macrolide efflux protein-like MFS transporter [Paenibacillus sp. PastF-3]